MTKSLSARIAESAAAIKKPSNLAAFMTVREDVKQAIDDGWPVKLIWKTLHEEGKVSFSYQAFRGYTNRLILSLPASKEAVRPPVAADTWVSKLRDQTTAPAVEKKPDDSAATTGFTFNRAPKKEDLL